jgi:acyl-CoA synthetase (AMP-forming)/AMP-acid ligase II
MVHLPCPAAVREASGCRLAVLDSPEFVATFFGTIKAGGIPVPVNPEAFIVLDDRADEDIEGALRQLVRQRLGGNKTPRAFHFVEALPKTATGKIQRFKLRQMASGS